MHFHAMQHKHCTCWKLFCQHLFTCCFGLMQTRHTHRYTVAFATVCISNTEIGKSYLRLLFKSLHLFILETAVVHLDLDFPGEEKHFIGWFMDDKTHIFVAGSPMMFNFTMSDYWNILILYAIIPKRLKWYPPCPTYPILHLPVQITRQGEIGYALFVLPWRWDVLFYQKKCISSYVLACTPTVMYSRQAPRTTALHNDQSLRDARAWLQPAVLTFEVITIPKPHSPHILSPICTRTHVATRSKVVCCVMFLDAARVLMKG